MTHTLKKGKRQNSTCAFLAKSRWLSVLPFPPPLDLLPLTPPLDLLSFPPPALSSVISVNHSKAQKYFFLAKNKTYSPKASKSENLPPAYNCPGEPAEVFSSNVSKKEYCFYIEKKKQSKALWSSATRWQKRWVSLLRSGLWVWTPQAQHNIFKWLCKARERLSTLSCLFGGEHEDTAELNWCVESKCCTMKLYSAKYLE